MEAVVELRQGVHSRTSRRRGQQVLVVAVSRQGLAVVVESRQGVPVVGKHRRGLAEVSDTQTLEYMGELLFDVGSQINMEEQQRNGVVGGGVCEYEAIINEQRDLAPPHITSHVSPNHMRAYKERLEEGATVDAKAAVQAKVDAAAKAAKEKYILLWKHTYVVKLCYSIAY